MRFSVKTTTSKASLPEQMADHSAALSGTGRVFLSGVAVLTLSTVLVKVIGLLYKIPMLHLLGSEGMGYFNAAYEWYATLCVITTSGLPLALSMLVAAARAERNTAAVRRLERLAMRVFVLLGLGGSLLLFFGAGIIAQVIGSPDTRFAIAAVGPTVLFSCISGAYRGYYQGHQDMMPTAISQVIEALGKLLLGLLFAALALRQGASAPHIAAYAMLGLAIGVAVSTAYLMWRRRGYDARTASREDTTPLFASETRSQLGRLLRIAVPITLSSAVLSLTRLFDMTMILRRLQDIGYDSTTANALYGDYTTMAVPMFNLIPSLVTSIALALVPTLSAAIQAGDHAAQRSAATTAIRVTALLSMPASLAVAIYSHTILSLLFRGEAAAVATAAPMLSVLALSIVFSCVITTTNAILQAYGRAHLPILSMLIGAMIKLAAAYMLIGQPAIRIYGAPISTLLCDAVIVGINFALIAKNTPILSSLRPLLLRPLLWSLLAVGGPGVVFVLLSRVGYPSVPLFFGAVPLTLLFYGLLCLRGGLIGERELSLLPGGLGERLCRICRVKKIQME